MKTLKNRLFLFFLILYGLVFVIFLGKILFEVNKKPMPTDQSLIPNLSLIHLNKISTKLEEREKLNYPGKIDLTKIQFGKFEPFNP